MVKLFTDISIKKGYLFLVLKLSGFLIIAFVLDFIVGGLFNYFYFKQTSGWEYRTKYAVEDTRADILIFGASRAQQQYNPEYFEKRLHQSCYNAGRDGQPVFYHYALLKGILKRYNPKMIILDIENGMFKEYQSSNDRLSVLLPFYKNHPEMRPVIELKSPYEKFKLVSRIYPYNSLFFKIAIGNAKFNKKRDGDIKGYLPLTRSLNETIRTVNFSKPYPIDNNKVNCYKSFINDCIKAGVKMFIVCSPYFINSVGEDTSMVLAKKIARENHIDFIDFSRDELFLNDSRLFDDTVHVNMMGSKLFSNKLIDSIIIKNKIRG